MANHVHYEIFRRQGAKGGWTLHETCAERESAIGLAETLMVEERATGVKVVKETYNEDTGDFLTLKIFEEGHNQLKLPAAAEEAPHALPCFKPDDLYSYHARATMSRLFGDFLRRNKITITELIHRADMLEKLEATGSVYQHAVQKIAVAQAASTTRPVQQIIKTLNELATKAIQRVYRDQRRGLFPDPRPDQFAVLAAQLASDPQSSYIFNGALARHLKEASGWDQKVLMLITIMEDAPKEEAARKLVLSCVDKMLAEIMSGSAALHELLGPMENLSVALNQLVTLFLGATNESAGEGLAALTQHFSADDLPEARTSVAKRIVAEFKSNKRLCPDSLVDELKALRSIANRIVVGVGKYLSQEDLIAAFTMRSKRLVTQETLNQYISDAPADEKLERLLFIEDNIIGAENKRQLASYVMPLLNSASFESFFLNPRTALVNRLQRLAQLQSRVRRSGFVEVSRGEIERKLDQLALVAESRGKLFDSIEARNIPHAEKAQLLLRLVTGGALTEGALLARAREMILAYVSRPGFLAGYIAQQNRSGEAAADGEKLMAELVETLGKAGITAETGLKLIAA